MKKTLTIVTALCIAATLFAESLPTNIGQTISDTITLQHAKSLKTIVITTGDLIKVEGSLGKVKGEIVSISKKYISIKPKSKKDPILDSIDVNQLIWIRKYNQSRVLRATGVGVQFIGFVGIPVSILTFLYGSLDEQLYLVGAGAFLGSLATIKGGSNLQGTKRYINSYQWTLVQ